MIDEIKLKNYYSSDLKICLIIGLSVYEISRDLHTHTHAHTQNLLLYRKRKIWFRWRLFGRREAFFMLKFQFVDCKRSKRICKWQTKISIIYILSNNIILIGPGYKLLYILYSLISQALYKSTRLCVSIYLDWRISLIAKPIWFSLIM